MDMRLKVEKIYVTVDNQRIEATGETLESIIDFQTNEEKRIQDNIKTANEIKIKRQLAEAKLEAIGLTLEDLQALGLA